MKNDYQEKQSRPDELGAVTRQVIIEYEGSCKYCGRPRPKGYSSTCGGSDCQEANYHDKERRRR